MDMPNNFEDKRWKETLESLDSVRQGKVFAGEQVHEWLHRWGTSSETAFDDVQYCQYVSEKVQRGLKRANEEGVVSHEDVVRKFS